jgi:beta-lactamase class A
MRSNRRLFVTALGAALAGCGAPARKAAAPGRLDVTKLSAEFPRLAARARPAQFGAGVALIGSGQSWTSDARTRFPMQSVFKAPMAAAALAEADAGRLKLGERITITETELSPPFSAINQAWPTPPDHHSLSLPAVDLIALAVQRSDNTAADVIMKRVGGPGAVTAWLQQKGLPEISIDRYERELQQEIAGMPPFQPAWKDEGAWLAARNTVPALAREAAMAAYLADPRDTATLPGTLTFLTRLAIGELLSPTSTRLLLALMTASVTGAHRLKAGLPAGASLAHKTGSARTDLGLTPATNDVGIVTLADGRRFAAAAYLAGSTATEAQRDRLIADAAALFAACVG